MTTPTGSWISFGMDHSGGTDELNCTSCETPVGEYLTGDSNELGQPLSGWADYFAGPAGMFCEDCA